MLQARPGQREKLLGLEQHASFIGLLLLLLRERGVKGVQDCLPV